ncbi:ATP-dependent RNA helicase HrpA [Tessaracoccus antarcticus]|uniref:ATP-dependent RNA helicase HrpA n=1 Tax=Tessaracoccus antarcticus TaxID=2479848 RepID=A0A3M0G8Z8_9ACTN|nr:ATP-dependent RNA helicase HrpA [Tessaracoccus antarcticus]RMB58902.1 ATP-dependent RNA helicase HrpA [Tessaracoccus antarcticus]
MTDTTRQPRIHFDESLPISAEVTTIANLIREHQVVVVAGETGSGKTTQLPKICLLAGREHIAHTQPRRIAARTVAQRIADECEVELGDFVGYQVRFTRRTSKATRIKLMTDGVLLSELTRDKDLTRYDTIIIDEAHERSLNIDFLLGYLKQLLPRRPELRVIVTSATIDTRRFSEHFSDAPVVEVSGRTYPVDIRYQPLADDADELDGLTSAMKELAAESGTGDVLVFLSGEREIRDAAEAINGLRLRGWETTPLYARLSAEEQQRVFQPHPGRRVVLATNVAETSITVPGIRYVIDVGTARISRYSARTKVQRLPIEPVSQASANQRAGRCGRLGPGIAIRLYSQEDFESRPRFTEPEILRTNLATVILQMTEAGLGDIEAFPFVEAPIDAQISDGVRVLAELGAIHPRKRHDHLRLTRTGRTLARLPIDPRLGRMLLEGSRRGCLRQMQVVVAGLTIPDVRERPTEQQQKADDLHRRFWTPGGAVDATPPEADAQPLRHTAHTGTRKEASQTSLEGGDFETLLNVWEYLQKRRKELSGNAFRRMCRQEYLHFVRFREWEDLVTQLREVCRELEMDARGTGSMGDVVTCLLSGLLSNVGLAEPERVAKKPGKRKPLVEYLGARGAHFAIQPGSSLARSTPPLVMAYELVETSRLWARTVTAITPEMVEAVGEHVLTRTLSEPHFSARSASVVANERLTLFGVPIVAGRPTSYASGHPEEAREIFIRTGIVEGEWDTRHPIVAANRFALEEAQTLTDRMRRPDLLLSDDELFTFWDQRLGAEVVSGATFESWVRGQADDSFLRLTPADCVSDPGELRVADFPDRWEVGRHELPVAYVFEPGAGRDGVTITVALELLNQLEQTPFTWQVPGLRRELATALLRSLPKAIRTKFVPAPDWAGRALVWLDANGGTEGESLPQALARALRALTGELVPPEAWQPSTVDGHLRPTFVVMDGSKEVARGTDLDELRVTLAPKVSAKLTRSAKRISATGQTRWTFGTVAPSVQLSGGVVGYPALVDETASVGLVVAESVQRASHEHVRGLRRLLTLVNPSPVRWVVSHMSNQEKLALGASSYASVPDLLADAWLKASQQLLLESGSPDDVRDEATFTRIAELVRADCPARTQAVVRVAAQTLTAQGEVERALQMFPPQDPLRIDVTEQLANLTFTRFISATPDPWFDRLPVYVRAMTVRMQGALKSRSRDDRARLEIEGVEVDYAALCDAQPPGPLSPAVEEIAFLIEELRVGLFAQGVRTAVPVSPKRVRQAIAAAR